MPDIEETVTPDPVRRARFEAVAAQVFEPLQRYLGRRASAADAEDALSDVMLTVWRRLDDAPESDVLPWCYGIARMTLANQRRSRSRHLRLIEKIEAQPPQPTTPDPADVGPDAELAAALAELSADDQEVLRLWAWEQLEPREIGPVLGISVNAATLRLGRARSRLGDALARQDFGPTGHQSVKGTQEAR
ncbi:MAG TPA: sigma-70 family RNA polymerase sigma factor [Acidimicrobiia bacterium]|nr:sigma-70 family RNA polymerase sigma factor [Acidimicrobiia bacterium]